MQRMTPAQRRVLDLAERFTDVTGSNHTDENAPCVSTAVAERLVAQDLLTRTHWTGCVYAYRITEKGREAVGA